MYPKRFKETLVALVGVNPHKSKIQERKMNASANAHYHDRRQDERRAKRTGQNASNRPKKKRQARLSALPPSTPKRVEVMKRQAKRYAATPRAIKIATDHMENLKSCLIFLLSNGIRVIGYNGHIVDGKAHITVTADASPHLWRLYGGHCETNRRRQDGAFTVETWVGRHSSAIDVEWEETRCGM
jgi:hypothetical protein